MTKYGKIMKILKMFLQIVKSLNQRKNKNELLGPLDEARGQNLKTNVRSKEAMQFTHCWKKQQLCKDACEKFNIHSKKNK